MYKSFWLFLCCLPLFLQGQAQREVFFYDEDWTACDSSGAYYQVVHEYDGTDTARLRGFIRRYRWPSGQLLDESTYADIGQRIREGFSLFYHESGAIKASVPYVNGRIQGELTTFYPNGQLRRRDFFHADSLIQGNCYTAQGRDTAHFPYNVLPVYSEGMEALYRFVKANIQYPKKAMRDGVGGRVVLRFIVSPAGVIQNIKIEKKLHPLLDAEALRVLQLLPGAWIPGRTDGETARYGMRLPIDFRLG